MEPKSYGALWIVAQRRAMHNLLTPADLPFGGPRVPSGPCRSPGGIGGGVTGLQGRFALPLARARQPLSWAAGPTMSVLGESRVAG